MAVGRPDQTTMYKNYAMPPTLFKAQPSFKSNQDDPFPQHGPSSQNCDNTTGDHLSTLKGVGYRQR